MKLKFGLSISSLFHPPLSVSHCVQQSVDYIYEVVVDVVPLDVCGVVFGSPYVYKRDAIFMRRENQCRMIKDGKSW